MTMRTVRLKDVVLGEGPPKVIVPITGTTADEVLAGAEALTPHEIDIVEWRVDFLGTAPDVGASMPASMLSRVLLPLPERPVSAVRLPPLNFRCR